jgi:phage baseplate assembly protein V
MAEEIRVGKISSIDYAAGLVRVAYHDKDDSVTKPIPMLSNEYNMPQVGDQVMVLHLSNGAEAGLVLGRYWNSKNTPPESGAGLYRKDLARAAGEAMIRYAGGTLTIKAAKVVEDGNVEVTGNLSVKGTLTVTGDITAQSVTTAGDVVAGGKSLISHTHTDSMGGSTTAPK